MDPIQLNAQLCEAVRAENINEIQQLLDTGAPVNLTRARALPPMHEAASRNFVRGLEMLHAHGAQIDFQDEKRATPLIEAAYRGQIEAGRWLLRHGANPMVIPSNGEPALFLSLSEGYIGFADMMLKERPDLCEEELISTARRLISTSSNVDVARWLLSVGVSPNLVNESGDTLLIKAQHAAEVFCHPLSELLLAAGADANIQGYYRKTALHYALELKSKECFIRLLRAGASPDLPDNHGRTVRDLLRKPGHHDFLDTLNAYEVAEAAHRSIEDSTHLKGWKPL